MFVIIISLISFCERTMTRPKSVGISVFKENLYKVLDNFFPECKADDRLEDTWF